MNKKYNVSSRLIFGFFAGAGIGHINSIIASLIASSTKYYFVVPSFLEMMGGNEILAAIIATIVYGLLGIVFAISSIVWQIEGWGILKKSLVYYFVTVVPTIVAGGLLKWFRLNFMSLLIFILIFTVIFMIIWVISYLMIRNEIKKLNLKLKQKANN